jgi:hypothetical protein
MAALVGSLGLEKVFKKEFEMKTIKYAKPCKFDHLGRSGPMRAHGISVDSLEGEIILEAVHSRGHSSSAIIMVALDSIPELIAELQDVEFMCRRIAQMRR